MRTAILRSTVFFLALMTAAPSQAGDGRWFSLFRLAERNAPNESSRPYTPTYAYTPRPIRSDEYRASYEVATAPPAVEASAYAAPAPAQPVYGGDSYGFLAILNRYRVSVGLHPVSLDPNLSVWASQNNAAQCRRGIGHHINPNCFQNCGWNYASATGVFQGWLHSSGHRDNMLSPSIRRVGIAYGPGPYWTMNAR